MAYVWVLIAGTSSTGGSGSSTVTTYTEAPARERVTMTVWEQSAPVLVRRIVDRNTGSYIDPDSVIDVVLRVYDLDSETPHTAVYELPMSWEECLFETMQTGRIWTEDAEGYNFRHQLWPDLLDEGGHSYRVEYTFTMLGEDPMIPEYDITRVWILNTRSRFAT